MRVCIAGSRDTTEEMERNIREYVAALPPGATVVHGGAPGADVTAHLAAVWHGYASRCVRPEYARYHWRKAPLWRNERMAGMVEHCAVFWRRGSRGSENMIANAYAAGVPVEVYVYP